MWIGGSRQEKNEATVIWALYDWRLGFLTNEMTKGRGTAARGRSWHSQVRARAEVMELKEDLPNEAVGRNRAPEAGAISRGLDLIFLTTRATLASSRYLLCSQLCLIEYRCLPLLHWAQQHR